MRAELAARLNDEDLDRIEQDHKIKENAARIDILHIQRDARF